MRKTHNSDHAKQANPNPDSSDFARRRKIMLGMASAPVVLTLSNAAQANASSHQCVTGFQPGQEPACTAVADASEANTALNNLNTLGWAGGPVNSDANDSTGTNLTGLDGNTVLGADEVCVAYVEETTPGVAQTAYVGPNGFIDQDGNSAGGFNGNPVTVSCLASFA